MLNFWVHFVVIFGYVGDDESLYCPIVAFKDLIPTDQIIVKSTKKVVTHLKNLHNIGPLDGRKVTELSGSIHEGAILPKMFKQDLEFPDGVHRLIECDVEFVFLTLNGSYKSCVEDTKKGYLNWRLFDKCSLLKLSNSTNAAQSLVSKDGYFLSNKIKEHLIDVNNLKEKSIQGIFNRFHKGIRISEVFQKPTKATASYGFKISKGKEPFMKFEYEHVGLIKINWKPYVILDWEYRQRAWPNMDDLRDELKVGYIIPKPSFEEKNNPLSIELRYSFSHIERKIVSLQSENQRLVYTIFKSIVYKWIIPIDEDSLTSYMCKTVMLWTCEKYPPAHSFWNIDKQSILHALKSLLKQLSTAFWKRYLPYYFIPDINVIVNVDKHTSDAIIKALENITENVYEKIPTNVDVVKTFIESLLSDVEDFIKLVKSEDNIRPFLYGVFP